MEWLSHSNKKYCELCKTPFRFTKLYDSHMPNTLPLHIFARKAALHTLSHILTWARAIVVAIVWLLVLPWCIRWSWRALFYVMDAGWARDAWLAREQVHALQPPQITSLADTVADALNSPSSTPSAPSEPMALNFSKLLIGAILSPWRPFANYRSAGTPESAATLADAATSTLLSNNKSLNSLASSPSLNRFILDVLEGQIITLLIVIAFILVFLIREWVVQQQPIINAAAQLRDAELQVDVVEHAAQRLRNRHVHIPLEEGDVPLLANHFPEEALDDSERDTTSDASTDDATIDDLIFEPDDGPNHAAPFNDSTQAGDQPSEVADSTRRPEMPPRDSSARINNVLQAMEEAPSNPGAGTGSTDSRDSWQSIFGGDEATPTSTASPASASTNDGHVVQERQQDEVVDDATSSAIAIDDVPLTNVDDGSEELIDVHPHEPIEQSDLATQIQDDGEPAEAVENAALDEPDETPTANEPTANRDPELAEDYDTLPSDQGHQENRIPAVDAPPPNLLQRVLNWFWADIVPDAALPPVDPFDEAIIEEEAEEEPFVRFQVDEAEAARQPNNIDAQDLEVMQAAAEAGLDAEALDEVEDLEGILELIGMQGPLMGLVQTAMFCGVLITTTLWAALGAPYLFGKVALLFLGDPLVLLVMAPLRLVSLIADAVVDSTIYLGGLVTFLIAEALSQVSAWLMRAFYMNVEAKSFDFLARRANGAIHAAGGRLSELLVGNGAFETGPLMVSLHAHRSLQTLQMETAQVFAFLVRAVATTSSHLQSSTIGQTIHAVATLTSGEIAQAKTYYSRALEYLYGTFAANVNSGTFTLTVTRESTRVDPSLAYWSSTDRCLTIFAGYIFLAMVGTAYLLRKEPLFRSATLQRVEKGFTDFLKQAGGVLKVILIISIEMLVFPLYCGLLLNCALLPLFENASVGTRLLFALRHPVLFAFINWFIGTCYMFHFALFVSACRRVLRSGVLYFIRDPDDPTFHPVRDVLERNVTTQLRKIAFSAMVYGALVICCLGGVVWGIESIFTSVFPIRWATPEPLLEFPIDFLIFNLLAPIVSRFLLPSKGVEAVFKLWLKHCARGLRLSHFLFGDRQHDEENRRLEKTPSDTPDGPDQSKMVYDGMYVRVPASDQVRIPKGDRVFLEVTEDNKRVDGQVDSRAGLHGRHNRNFTKVYVPPWFRLRIALFIFGLWFFAAGTGVGITIVPMVFGRQLLSATMPERVHLNDLYAFSAGLVTLGGAIYVALKSKDGYRSIKTNLSRDNANAVLHGANACMLRLLKSMYVYGFALIVVPTLFALVLQLYLILPLHTYTSSWSSGSDAAVSEPTSALNVTTSALPTSAPSSSVSLLAGHTMHVLQDWTLGFLYGRIVLRLLLLSRNSRPATALRLITRDGYTNPDAKLATRAFVAPTLLLFSIILLCPPVFASAANSILFAINFTTGPVPQALRIKVYRYSYPVCASQVLVLWGAWEVVKATQRWRNRIKDEVYLIGERLHNFGERRPPEGSKSAVRRGR